MGQLSFTATDEKGWPPCTSTQLALLFGVSRKTVYMWVSEGMPKNGKVFDPPECVKWYMLRQGGGGAAPELNVARKRLYDAQCERTELENAKMRGELLDYEETKSTLMAIGASLASQLDGLGPRLAHDLVDLTDPAAIQTAIFVECRELRRQIAHELLAIAGGASDGGDSDAAAGPARRPVGRRAKSPATRKSRARKVAK